MGAFTIYAIKSAICLIMLYLPFSLLLRRETFFTFNRCGLLFIVALSLVVPFLNIPLWDLPIQDFFERQQKAVVEVGMPILIKGEQTVSESQMTANNVHLGWVHILVYAYMIGMATCLMLKGRQLFRLLRFIPKGCLWTDKQDGVNIYCHADNVGALSWMNSIVVNESDSAPDSPVMLHEMTHVRRGHSWDALFVSLVETLQWFNPCIWMVDLSLREIHEYEADDAVLRRGITARNYQLLLIKNAVLGSNYALANTFSHSLLKKRITMMMKKRSNKWARMRLLYVVPATMIVLGTFASRHFATQTTSFGNNIVTAKNEYKENGNLVDIKSENYEPILNDETVEQEPTAHESETIELATDTTILQAIDGKRVYDVVEVQPEFPGGMEELMKYLSTTVKYPKIAEEQGVQGRYIVKFIVTNEGDVTDVSIAHKPNGNALNEIVVVGPTNTPDSLELAKQALKEQAYQALEEEALRVVKAMPKWKPGYVEGKPVHCCFNLPISFRLR